MAAPMPRPVVIAPSLASGWWRRALLLALSLALPAVANAQFSAAGSAAAESAAENASHRDEVASYGTRNIYRVGRTVRVGSAIEGDFHAGGSRVVIDAPIAGDAMLGGGSVEIRHPVGGDLRTLAGKLTLDAPVTGDALVGGVELLIDRQARIGGDALIAGRSVEVRGAIRGELTVYAQQVLISGPIEGRVRLVAEEIELLEGARLSGALSYTSPNEIKRAPGVVVEGQITRTEKPAHKPAPPPREARPWIGWGMLGIVLWSLGLFAFGVVMMAVFPALTGTAVQSMATQPWPSLGLGLAMALVTPVVAGVAILTIVGIPLGASVLALYPVWLLAGYLVGVWAVAKWARRALGRSGPESMPAMVAWLGASLLVLLLVGVVPFLGWIISAWVTLAGMGALTLALWNRRGITSEGKP